MDSPRKKLTPHSKDFDAYSQQLFGNLSISNELHQFPSGHRQSYDESCQELQFNHFHPIEFSHRYSNVPHNQHGKRQMLNVPALEPNFRQNPNNPGGLLTPPRVVVRANETPSPVLTTEQLYQSARWTEDCLPGEDSDDLDDLLPGKCEEKIRRKFSQPQLGLPSPQRKLNFSSTALSNVSVPFGGTLDDTERQPSRLEEIPTSMAEIYQLSNKNRKEKKKKTKADFSPSVEETKLKDKQKENENFENPTKDDYDSAIDFMKKIGWLNGQDVPVRPTRNQATKKSQNFSNPKPHPPKGRGGGSQRNNSRHNHNSDQMRQPQHYGGHQQQNYYSQHNPYSVVYPMQYPPHYVAYQSNVPQEGIQYYQH